MHSIAIEQLFPIDEIEERFREFHAYELFKGEGAFKGIPQDKRFNAIRVLLMAVHDHKLPFIYGAVDEKKLSNSVAAQGLFGTAHPLSAAFKLCLLGVEKWAQAQHLQRPEVITVDYKDQYLFIADDTKEQELKKQLQSDYRRLRSARPYVWQKPHRLYHSHDAMYFGDSTQSVGIQLADLCAYLLLRHLLKRDYPIKDGSDEFYEMFAGQVICAKPEPEWSQHSELLVTHDS